MGERARQDVEAKCSGAGSGIMEADTLVATSLEACDPQRTHQLSLRELLVEDFATYERRLTEPGLWAVVAHRLGSAAVSCDSGVQRVVLEGAHRMLARSVDLLWGIELPRSVRLGRRVRLWHSGCMYLQAKAIGDDVHIRHDTTLGPLRARDYSPDDLPIIEDRAELGSGVCVLGAVRVGHDAFVGANSLVLKHVPPRATAIGVPARQVPQ